LAGARPSAPDFDAVAVDYDRLRPVDEKWWELFDALASEGDLVGRRVLDLGCGTGNLAGALAERGGKVWALDPSPEMLERARTNFPGVRFKEGSAETLPFKDGWFERVVVRLALHLFDRPRALAEISRVLAPGGRVAIATFDPAHFDGYWLNELFPSLEALDRARFPSAEVLAAELEDAGLTGVRLIRLGQSATATRDEALERIRGRYISTLRMLASDEYEEGLARAGRELPERIDYRLEWLLASAERPTLDAVRSPG
jgi:SAM-dependent methyltransferase